MSGNPARNLKAAAADVEKHIELVQPRKVTDSSLQQKEAAREKIKVRAAKRSVMAAQMLAGGKEKKKSRLVPAEGGGMGMGMNVD